MIEALGDALTVQSGDARTTTSFADTGCTRATAASASGGRRSTVTTRALRSP